MNKLKEVSGYGQAFWLAYLRRAFIESGELRAFLDSGIRGIITDIAVTEKAIRCSADYDRLIQRLIAAGKPAEEIYEALLIDDAQRAADYLHPIFEESEGVDGYVILPLDPALAHDAVRLVASARRLGGLCARLDRPNSMVEIPATAAGVVALRQLIADGCNVSVSHIFSPARYRQVAAAYLEGLEAFLKSHSVWRQTPSSVAGFSLAPIDNAVDPVLVRQGYPELQGKTAIALARNAYHLFQEILSGERWERLARQGAKPQRLLWRDSTPANFTYPRTWYTEALIGPETVQAVSLATLNTFEREGDTTPHLDGAYGEARSHLALVADAGIDVEAIALALQAEMIEQDAVTYRRLVQSVLQKRDELETSWHRIRVEAGPETETFTRAVESVCDERLMCRIWLEDESVWPESAPPSLGWLHVPEIMEANGDRLENLRREVQQAGYEKVVVLGTDRAARATALFAGTFSRTPSFPGSVPYSRSDPLPLEMVSIDDEDALAAAATDPALLRHLFLLMDEPGSANRLRAAFYRIHDALTRQTSKKVAGKHCVAVTQRGSPVVEMARAGQFRALFVDDPQSPGDFAFLGYSGLVPATLAGADPRTLIARAGEMACNASGCNCPLRGDNIAAQAGTALGTMAAHGRQYLTLIPSPALVPLATWVAQFLASCSHHRLQPLVDETVTLPAGPSADQLYVFLHLEGDERQAEVVQTLADENRPLVVIRLKDLYDLGGQVFFWQMVAAVAAYHLQVNPFAAVTSLHKRGMAPVV